MIISDYFIIITINIFVLQRKEPFKKENKKRSVPGIKHSKHNTD